VIVIGPATATALSRDERRAAIAEGRLEVDGLVAGGLGRSEAARRVAAATGLSRRALYRTEDETEDERE
jgi:hypothetical protein